MVKIISINPPNNGKLNCPSQQLIILLKWIGIISGHLNLSFNTSLLPLKIPNSNLLIKNLFFISRNI